MLRIIAVSLTVGLVTFHGRMAQPQGPTAWALQVNTLPTPAAAGSAQPQLAVSTRGILLSWIEKTADRAALKFSERTADGWSPPRTVASGTDWFINWADVPSVIRLADGTLAAHWLQKSGAETYAYDVRLSYSRDNGKAWAASFTPHHDGTRTEHGFASLFQMPGAKGGLGVVWLDGRNMKSGHGAGDHDTGEMSLRVATFDRDWTQHAEIALDSRVCECCPTAVTVTSDGPIVAYRDRAAGEIRDIHTTRLAKGRWTDPEPVAKDDWQFPACPVNGPAISSRARNVAVAYFQAKDGKPKSLVAFSSDGGQTFGTPVRVDEEGSLGRVDVEVLPDGSAAVAYIDLAANRAELRVKRVRPSGAASAPVTIADLANDRSSGYPRMALHGEELVFAWVDRKDGSSVRTAVAHLGNGTR
jgi:hypothetical protein